MKYMGCIWLFWWQLSQEATLVILRAIKVHQGELVDRNNNKEMKEKFLEKMVSLFGVISAVLCRANLAWGTTSTTRKRKRNWVNENPAAGASYTFCFIILQTCSALMLLRLRERDQGWTTFDNKLPHWMLRCQYFNIIVWGRRNIHLLFCRVQLVRQLCPPLRLRLDCQ